MAKKLTGTGMITGEIRASYANAFVPKGIQGSEPKYSIAMLIPKSDTETLNMINACVEAAKQEGVTKHFGGVIPPDATLKLPLRDGDAEKPGDEVYAGHYFINASSKNKPGVIKQVANKSVPIDEDEFYSGCYCKVSVNFYAYNVNSKGIACGLNNILKTRDGDKLSGGGKSAAEDFGLDEDGNEFL